MPKQVPVQEKASFLRDAIFAANDGVITTFAVVAGAYGASLSSSIVIILGFANLFADGFSMATGNYLGVKSETDLGKVEDPKNFSRHSPFPHALVTFFSFMTAGLLPLLPYFFKVGERFFVSAFLVGITLFAVGAFRCLFTKKRWFWGGLEMFLVGGAAAFVAYITGYLLNKYVV